MFRYPLFSCASTSFPPAITQLLCKPLQNQPKELLTINDCMWKTCEGWSLRRSYTIWLFDALEALCCTVSIIRIGPSKWVETRPKNTALPPFTATALALSHTNFPALDNVTAVDGREDGALPNARREEWGISGRGLGVKERVSKRDNMWMGFYTRTLKGRKAVVTSCKTLVT